jgi:hypothetical protein
MIKYTKSYSATNFFEILLLLAILAVFFDGGNYIYGTAAFRQEADGLQVEQFIDYPAKVQRTATIHPAKSINPFLSQIFLTSLHDVLCLVENASASEPSLPGFGQIIVSFLAKTRTCHSTSEKPHLFSC